MDKKQGLSPTPNSASMSKWKIPTPAQRKPDDFRGKSPAGGGGGAKANKHANTPSGTHGLNTSIKSRY